MFLNNTKGRKTNQLLLFMCIVSTQYCSKWPEGVVDTAKINTHFPPLLSFLITAFTTTASGHLFCYIPLISILKKIIDLKFSRTYSKKRRKGASGCKKEEEESKLLLHVACMGHSIPNTTISHSSEQLARTTKRSRSNAPWLTLSPKPDKRRRKRTKPFSHLRNMQIIDSTQKEEIQNARIANNPEPQTMGSLCLVCKNIS
jgi:hypothetical protein